MWLRNLLQLWYKFEKSILNKIPSFRGNNDFVRSVHSKLQSNFLDKEGDYELWELYYARDEDDNNIYGDKLKYTSLKD